MSKTQILKELAKLTPAERAEIQARLDELAGSIPMIEAEKTLIESRVAAHEKNHGSAIPWAEFDARLKRKLGRHPRQLGRPRCGLWTNRSAILGPVRPRGLGQPRT
jgi:putative addiction module component (TIGR02574 family)